MTEKQEPSNRTSWGPGGGWEVAIIVALMAIYGGSLVPGINESHYLTRMKHFWDSTWCAGDLFLDSGESHPAFHTVFGWPSTFLSLPALAWTGRIIGWTLLAVGWLRFSRRVVPQAGWALLSAALVIVLWDRTHMAGEWVVGGFEAKVPAYALVFVGLGEFLRNHWGRTLILMGAAAAFHPLVGGWSLVALGFAWLVDEDRPALKRLAVPLVVAFLISMLGVIPALRLDAGVDAEAIAQARRAYVLRRLGHHLLFWRLPPYFHLRHVVLIGAWLWLWRTTSPDASQNRLQRFVLGCVLIAVIGLFIETITYANWIYCSAWMRYYWYRMTDSMVPVGFSMLACRALFHKQSTGSDGSRRAQWGKALIAAMCIVSLGLTVLERRVDRRPPADRQGRTKHASVAKWAAEYQDWRAVCDWCHENSSPEDIFLTPTYTQTFKWYAERPEFVTWKDIPQDSQSIVEWSKRRREVRYLGVYFSKGKPTQEHFSHWVSGYDIDYVVASRMYGDPEWVYPILYENTSYRVYQIMGPAAESP